MLAAPAHASRTMEIGIQDDAVFVDQVGYGRIAGLTRAKELGVTTVRANMIWARVLVGKQSEQRARPAKPRYDLIRFEQLVTEARAAGLRVELTLTGPAPRWATADKAKASTRNPSAKEFARFTSEIAKHFKGRVARYSIWNEPNWHSWLSPARTAAAQYRKLYTASYSAIKRADRKAEVVLGELAPQARPGASFAPLRFLRDVLCVDTRWKKRGGCGTVRADAVSLHPYDYKNPPTYKRVPTDDVTIGTVSRLTNALTRLRKAKALATAGNREPAVHLTEFAYFASGPLAFPRATRARYITQAFELARKNPKISQLLYFGLMQNPDVQWNTGLLRPNGTPDDSFTALKSWTERETRAGRLAPSE
ncbi:cellulase family glycosylhydrolase [Solirubrobacter phytolaccae]|uniref:Cellulase family glycosylhydrolase n=1 Tax=Solirubrobacter phytolaccae TaxID=1404360 RepID=A0A9X3S7A8_9ACTN|nr:cellulase family glycosylhydrolase [Solirubrobacter phytolaccae]MDA0178926.1 cellulase family glycosylhydrolase [Solirubrobacter phytolaccae]